ncbi:SDR family NAD(P)-dependent oxidoreductase [Geomicrobium sp. JCM 19039]|uniref:SDR family NAD(P)-dependent oxidoreductase n=1 Tax=Geomicrobium sp. JCM 19039 TaxID=1460636 RepID=UPI00045F1A36|nr:SDR family NAD(P)-dependent oxidoreductase [Geomicrobium sp. JCM 19039]GAK10767.1 short-chain dehydrogenase/reductase SDR [Geomicrobium sp. JCM 19039]
MENKTVIITGSNSGIGFEAAKHFAQLGSHVVLAVRNVAKGEEAKDEILTNYPNAQVYVNYLDLAKLETVDPFVGRIQESFSAIDVLINNAGVMMPPHTVTDDALNCNSPVIISVTSHLPDDYSPY